MKTYIITGATSGLGLSIAKYLVKDTENRLILAVRDTVRGAVVAGNLGGNVEVIELDLRSLKSVDAFVSSWKGELSGLINNAGVQITNETVFTKPEGFEETFLVNHLAALKLTQGLLPFLTGGRVLFIGSGTHNPTNKTATIFGFRGAQFDSIKVCSEGLNEHEPINQLGMDRYATSKFLNMVTTVELARRMSHEDVSFFCLDPGLMPGTGLARTAPAALQFVWSNILPIVGKILPDTSTPDKSGKAAAWIMTTNQLMNKTGIIFSYARKPSKRVWSKVLDAGIGKAVLEDSFALLDR